MSTDGKWRILIVEDEVPILAGLTDVFVFHGFEVDTATDGISGFDKAKTGEYDLVLLDVMLPGMDGFSICNEIRKVNKEQPIIMLTAKTTDEDIINGLTLGADDYIAKPFSVREVVLRVEAVLRRTRKAHIHERSIRIGDLVIDSDNLIGKRKGKDIPFTRREISIIQYLLGNKDRPVSRGELLIEVWDYKKGTEIETRTVDIHIAKLRRKLELDPKNPVHLVTTRGEGYKLNP